MGGAQRGCSNVVHDPSGGVLQGPCSVKGILHRIQDPTMLQGGGHTGWQGNEGPWD